VFEDPLFGAIWTIQIMIVGLLFLGMVGFVVYYYHLARERDKQKDAKRKDATL
jgi:hypothetical protein